MKKSIKRLQAPAENPMPRMDAMMSPATAHDRLSALRNAAGLNGNNQSASRKDK